ncbi:MAG: phosphate acyltransferase PlsX [Gammaproteobacteria bacterium]|nr:phosphate acyltransferase PlsX [Gammaproteobacteria bacterium]
MTLTVALDAMGGDHGPSVVVPAALRAARMRGDLQLVLVGDCARIEPHLKGVPAVVRERSIHLRHASQTVDMDEPPAQAMRTKKDSSMRVAIDLVKNGEARACVSAGNTGALMATARFVLKTLPGIDRPAICSTLPTIDGMTHMLDLGANVECTAQHLVQFAVMGASLVSAVHHVPNPRVGLLNIGEEDIKGNKQVKQAGRMLEASALNYVGYLEGDNIYKDVADVVVCDGFSGNVALKSSEGVIHLVSSFMQQEFERNLLTRLAGLAALPVLRSLRRRLDPRRYNGGAFVGLRGVVVKSHGGADSYSFCNAIIAAAEAAAGDLTSRIETQLGGTLEQAVAG